MRDEQRSGWTAEAKEVGKEFQFQLKLKLKPQPELQPVGHIANHNWNHTGIQPDPEAEATGTEPTGRVI